MFHSLLDQDVYFAPSGYETLFPSLAHSDADIDVTIEAAIDAARDAASDASADSAGYWSRSSRRRRTRSM